MSICDCVTQRRQTGQFRRQERVRVRKMNFGLFRQLSANRPGHLLPDIVDSERGICQETRQFRERGYITIHRNISFPSPLQIKSTHRVQRAQK